MDLVKIIIGQKGFNYKAQYQEANPLQFAVINNKLEIVKFLLTEKKFVKASKDDICLFEYAIMKKNYEIAEFLMMQSFLNSVSNYSLSAVRVPEIKIESKPNYYWDYKIHSYHEEKEYISNFIHYFLNNSNDEETEKKKKEIIEKNNGFVACFAAFTLNEEEFAVFFEKYKLDINVVEKKQKMTPLLSSMINKKYDVLKYILTTYKDTVNAKCKTAKGFTPLHILACKTKLANEGEKMLLTFNGLEKNGKEITCSYTPLHLAVLNDNLELVSYLLNDPETDVHALDNKKNTPFHNVFRCTKVLEMLRLFYNYSSDGFDLMKKNAIVLTLFSSFLLTFLEKNTSRILFR